MYAACKAARACAGRARAARLVTRYIVEGVAKERCGTSIIKELVTFGGLSAIEKERKERTVKGISFNQTRRICGTVEAKVGFANGTREGEVSRSPESRFSVVVFQ